MNYWTEERKAVERAVGELVQRLQTERHEEMLYRFSDDVSLRDMARRHHARAQAYENAITIIRRQFSKPPVYKDATTEVMRDLESRLADETNRANLAETSMVRWRGLRDHEFARARRAAEATIRAEMAAEEGRRLLAKEIVRSVKAETLLKDETDRANLAENSVVRWRSLQRHEKNRAEKAVEATIRAEIEAARWRSLLDTERQRWLEKLKRWKQQFINIAAEQELKDGECGDWWD